MVMVCIIFALCFLGVCNEAWADQEVSLTVHQGSVTQTVYLSGIIGSTTFLPVRDISAAIHVPLAWDQDTGSVVWQTNGQATVITPGIETVYVVKDAVTPYQFGEKAFMEEGRVYLPLRMVELLGVKVWYDAKTGGRGLDVPAHINDQAGPPAPEKLNVVRDLIVKEKEKMPKKMGSYATYFNLSYKSRTENLKLAAEALDNVAVAPGQIFSFNDTVGPRTPERGYREAIIFVNKQEVEGYGGGVCQVSTTLYNAVLAAGLEVVERHRHSLPVTYVPKGRDATVNFGTADFRFKNNTEKTVILHASVVKNKLSVEIFSAPIQ